MNLFIFFQIQQADQILPKMLCLVIRSKTSQSVSVHQGNIVAHLLKTRHMQVAKVFLPHSTATLAILLELHTPTT